MKVVTAVVGIPASGKSTWVLDQINTLPHSARINNDDLCVMLFGKPFVEYTTYTSRLLANLRNAQLKVMVQTDGIENVFIDNTNLQGQTLSGYKKICLQYGAKFVINTDFLKVDAEECIRRDALRGDRMVGEEVILKFAKQAEKFKRNEKVFIPYDFEAYEQPRDGRLCIIVDLDGTMAIHTGRNPYDFSLVHTDEPNHPVIDIIRHYDERPDVDVIFLSGRGSAARPQTEKWIREHMEWPDNKPLEFHMRKEGDDRSDMVVKYEIFNEMINGRKVLFGLDDRDQVVFMFRNYLRIPCFQVNYGDF